MCKNDTTDEQARRVELPEPPDFTDTPAALRAIYTSQIRQGAAINTINGSIRRIHSKLNEHKALEEKVEANKDEIIKHRPVINAVRWFGRVSGVTAITAFIYSLFS